MACSITSRRFSFCSHCLHCIREELWWNCKADNGQNDEYACIIEIIGLLKGGYSKLKKDSNGDQRHEAPWNKK